MIRSLTYNKAQYILETQPTTISAELRSLAVKHLVRAADALQSSQMQNTGKPWVLVPDWLVQFRL